jgi:hypothetical protein
VTGEESATLGALAAVCSDGLGRPFRYEPGSREEWIAGRLAAGRARWDAEAGCGCYDAVRLGEVDVTSDVVRRVGGLEPERPRGFVAAHPERFDLLGVAARAARGARA